MIKSLRAKRLRRLGRCFMKYLFGAIKPWNLRPGENFISAQCEKPRRFVTADKYEIRLIPYELSHATTIKLTLPDHFRYTFSRTASSKHGKGVKP
jgi:hypothetical protein